MRVDGQNENLLHMMGDLEKEISKAYFKFPFDHVMGLRVKDFHVKFIDFMQIFHRQF